MMRELINGEEKTVNFSINGIQYCESSPEFLEDTLLNYIRGVLRLTDVKCGCEKGFCGSCTVIINGSAQKSCARKIKNLEGAVVETPAFINSPALSKFSEMLDRHGAVQCGFCFPAIACSLEAKLKNIEKPSRQEVADALSGHVCRCTGYVPIIEAVAGDGIARGRENDNAYKNVCRSPVREDSAPKLSGSALYADDLHFENMLHVYILRSAHARARIVSIDADAARKSGGVALVLTHKELPGARKFGILKHDQPVLCSDKVLFYGDAVALVAAESLKDAKRAASLIKVVYEPLKPIFSAEASLAPGAEPLCEEGNLICGIELKSKTGISSLMPGPAPESGRESADAQSDGFVSVSGKFTLPVIEHAYMEPECSVARYDEESGTVTVYAGSQNIHAEKEEIAQILGLPSAKVEIKLMHTGGGFGGKEDLTTQPYSALAAVLTKRPCKYRMSRDESILCSTKKHPFDINITISADRNGFFGGIAVNAVSDAGPYASLSQIVLTRFATHILGPYTWRGYDVSVRGARTNNLIAGAMRGFGVNQACFAVESMIDRLAARLEMSPVEIRRKNMIEDGKTMGLGETASDCSGLKKAFEAVLGELDYESVKAFNDAGENKKRGIGLALAYKNMGLGNNSPRDNCSVRIAAVPGRRKLLIYTAASDIGQGLYNILRQIAAEASRLPLDAIEIVWGETRTAPPAGVTSASRQTFMSGNAVLKAVGEFAAAAAARISANYGLDPGKVKVEGGRVTFPEDFKNPDGINDLWDYIDKIEKGEFGVTSRYDAPRTSELDKAGEENFKSHFGYSYAAHGIIVEADLENKTFRILKIAAAHDTGRALNPVSLEGQIIGGVVMGLGYAVSENLKVENGLPDRRGLAGMGLLKAADIPPIKPVIIETPHPHGPYGARGVGEISTVPVAAALCNALREATGLDFSTLPINLNENGFKYRN